MNDSRKATPSQTCTPEAVTAPAPPRFVLPAKPTPDEIDTAVNAVVNGMNEEERATMERGYRLLGPARPITGVWTVTMAARMAGTTAARVRRACQLGDLEYALVGREIVIVWQQGLAWVARLREAAAKREWEQREANRAKGARRAQLREFRKRRDAAYARVEKERGRR